MPATGQTLPSDVVDGLFAVDYITGPVVDDADRASDLLSLCRGNADLLSAFAGISGVSMDLLDIVIDAAIEQDLTQNLLLEILQEARSATVNPSLNFAFRILADQIALVPWKRQPDATLFDAVPSLRTIWKPELAAVAASHSADWERGEDGQIYLVLAGRLVVGTIGWYPIGVDSVGLRWHGILPAARRHGFSRRAIDLMSAEIPAGIASLYEVTRNPESRAAFERLQFEIVVDRDEIQLAARAADYPIDAGGWVLRRRLNSCKRE